MAVQIVHGDIASLITVLVVGHGYGELIVPNQSASAGVNVQAPVPASIAVRLILRLDCCRRSARQQVMLISPSAGARGHRLAASSSVMLTIWIGGAGRLR